MSRETEKVLKELQKFLDAHAEDAADEADVDALTERFFAEYNRKCNDQKDSAPETSDDYLDLAEQATSKKKCVEYLHKALALEPDNLDARLQLITRTTEEELDEQRLALQELLDTADKQMEQAGAFKEYAGEFWTAPETRPSAQTAPRSPQATATTRPSARKAACRPARAESRNRRSNPARRACRQNTPASCG